MKNIFLFSANLPKSVEDTIIYYAQSCVRDRLCQGIRTIKAEELQNINKYDKSIIHPDNSRIDVTSLIFLFKNRTSCVMIWIFVYLQLNINVPVDIILKKITNYIKDNSKSIIAIPDVKKTTYLRWGVKCHFQTVDGTFQYA